MNKDFPGIVGRLKSLESLKLGQMNPASTGQGDESSSNETQIVQISYFYD